MILSKNNKKNLLKILFTKENNNKLISWTNLIKKYKLFYFKLFQKKLQKT